MPAVRLAGNNTAFYSHSRNTLHAINDNLCSNCIHSTEYNQKSITLLTLERRKISELESEKKFKNLFFLKEICNITVIHLSCDVCPEFQSQSGSSLCAVSSVHVMDHLDSPCVMPKKKSNFSLFPKTGLKLRIKFQEAVLKYSNRKKIFLKLT